MQTQYSFLHLLFIAIHSHSFVMSAVASTSVDMDIQDPDDIPEGVKKCGQLFGLATLLKLEQDVDKYALVTIASRVVDEIIVNQQTRPTLFSVDRRYGKTFGFLFSAAYISAYTSKRVAFIGSYGRKTSDAETAFRHLKESAPTIEWKDSVSFVPVQSLHARESRSGHESVSELTKLVASTDVFLIDDVEWTSPVVLRRLLKLIEEAKVNGRVVHIFCVHTASPYQKNILDIIKACSVVKWTHPQ